MDAITRMSAFFPTNTLTSFFIISGIIINDVGTCERQQRQLMIALLVIFGCLHFMACFTDTYTASNQQKFWVFILPFWGPLCFSLPTDHDKDRVYEFYYLRIRDYVHAVLSTATFLLIVIFTNPVCMCLFPSGLADGTSRFDASIVRTVPVVVAIIMAMLMVCLGEPRQMLGFQNVSETCPSIDRQLGDNPIYAKYPAPQDNIPEGEEGDEEMASHPLPPRLAPHPSMYSRGPSSRDGGGYRTPPQGEMLPKHEPRLRTSQPQAPSPRSRRSASPEPQHFDD
ncbi:hypothetical protein V8C86DRAFT_3129160 [Haematococcus lacustris]